MTKAKTIFMLLQRVQIHLTPSHYSWNVVRVFNHLILKAEVILLISNITHLKKLKLYRDKRNALDMFKDQQGNIRIVMKLYLNQIISYFLV